MRKWFILTAIISVIFISGCKNTDNAPQNSGSTTLRDNCGQPTQFDSLLLAQGNIKVYEPLKVLIGESDSAGAIYTITLRCVEKYHGKVCPGIATGFRMFQDIIDSLYPETGVAVRGQVEVTCSKPNDMLDVAGYIFGIRTNTCCGRSELGKGLLKVDTTLSTGVPKQFVMIFRRLDNGRAYKVTFNKFKLMDSDQWPFIDSVLHKYEHGEQLSREEAEKFAAMVHAEVMNVLQNGPRPGTYIIERIE